MTTTHAHHFNAWLDSLVSGTPPDGTNDTTAAALHDAAREFHAMAAPAVRHPSSTELPPSWEDFMNTHGIVFDDTTPAVSTAPAWNRQRPASSSGRPRVDDGVYGRDRASWWTRGANLVLTLLLVAGLAAGGWLAADRFGFGGFGQSEPPTSIPFAGLGQADATPDDMVGDTATPEPALVNPASIATADQCTIEPLTIDQVVALVHDPYLEETPDPDVTTATDDERATMAAMEVESTATASAEALEGVTTSFHMLEACIEANSYFQVWALLQPTTLQQSILDVLPPLTGETELRALLADLEANGPGEPGDTSSVFAPLAFSWLNGSSRSDGRISRVVDQNVENTWMPTDAYLVTGYDQYTATGEPVSEPTNIFDQNGNDIADFDEGISPKRAPAGCGSIVFTWSEARQLWLILSPPVCG